MLDALVRPVREKGQVQERMLAWGWGMGERGRLGALWWMVGVSVEMKVTDARLSGGGGEGKEGGCCCQSEAGARMDGCRLMGGREGGGMEGGDGGGGGVGWA